MQRFLAPQLKPPCTRGFFDDRAAIGWTQREDLVNQTLADHDERVVREVRTREQILEIAEAHARSVHEVLRLAVAEETAADLDLGEVDGQSSRRIVELQQRFGVTQRLACFASAEDELLVAFRAEHARVVLTEGPTNGIREVRFPRTVRTNDRGDSRCEFKMCGIHEALESCHAERLQHSVCNAAFDHLELVAHRVTSSMSFAAAASSAARFEAPVPCATLPATSTSTTKPRLCSGPLTSSVR